MNHEGGAENMEDRIRRRRDSAVGHPTRGAILRLLDGRALSIRELAGLSPEPSLATVAYHLAVLREAGLVGGPVHRRHRRAA
jgi:DNA-binding transcriptional ArsR family regulator